MFEDQSQKPPGSGPRPPVLKSGSADNNVFFVLSFGGVPRAVSGWRHDGANFGAM